MTEKNNLCPLRHLTSIFGGKWKLPIMCILSSDNYLPKRYSVIKRKLGDITNVMLAKSLNELEDAKLVHREQYNEIPPRVEYSLTEQGKETLPFLSQAAQWAIDDLKRRKVNIFCGECVIID